jgi:DNA replication protein DnaC
VLFRVVGIRHLKRRSTLVTTNKPLAALGQVLHDPDLAEAILDRLLERGTHYVLAADPAEPATTKRISRKTP